MKKQHTYNLELGIGNLESKIKMENDTMTMINRIKSGK